MVLVFFFKMDIQSDQFFSLLTMRCKTYFWLIYYKWRFSGTNYFWVMKLMRKKYLPYNECFIDVTHLLLFLIGF